MSATVTHLERRLTKAEYAEHLRCSVRWLEYRIAEGLPSELIAGGGRRGWKLVGGDEMLVVLVEVHVALKRLPPVAIVDVQRDHADSELRNQLRGEIRGCIRDNGDVWHLPGNLNSLWQHFEPACRRGGIAVAHRIGGPRPKPMRSGAAVKKKPLGPSDWD